MQTPGFHYTREAGDLGQVLAQEGGSAGFSLDALLERHRPGLRAAMELGAALADILCIAEEDRSVHGDLRPASVKVDGRGNVSIDGWGVPRRTTREPHGRTDVATTDMYGLGVVLHSVLSEAPFGDLPHEADGHDDAVIDRVLSMDFAEARGKRWLEDVRKFLCNILAWTASERPLPLDAANVLASVGAQITGDGLVAWAAGLRAPSHSAAPLPAPEPAVQREVLGGPTSISAPMARGGVRQAPASKGESTSFWSREKIKQMLAEEDDDAYEVAALPRRATAAEVLPPPVAYQAPTPPRPPTLPAEPPRPPSFEPPRPAAEPPRPPSFEPPRPEPARPAEAPRPTPVRHVSEPARSSRPVAPPPVSRSALDNDPFADPPAKSGMTGMVVGGVVLLLVCGGILAAVGGGWFFMGREEPAKEASPLVVPTTTPEVAPAEVPAPTPIAAPEPVAKPEPAAATPAPKPAATPAPPKPAPATKPASSPKPASTPKPVTTQKPAAAAKPAPATKPAPVEAAPPPSGPFSVKFSVPGKEGKIQCGDGQSAEFVSGTTMSFAGVTTCRVKTGGKDAKQGVIQVERGGTVTCSDFGSSLSCN